MWIHEKNKSMTYGNYLSFWKDWGNQLPYWLMIFVPSFYFFRVYHSSGSLRYPMKYVSVGHRPTVFQIYSATLDICSIHLTPRGHLGICHPSSKCQKDSYLPRRWAFVLVSEISLIFIVLSYGELEDFFWVFIRNGHGKIAHVIFLYSKFRSFSPKKF